MSSRHVTPVQNPEKSSAEISQKSRIMPRYPIYIPSLGRSDCCMTADFLREECVPFLLVVEEHEYDLYLRRYAPEHVLRLPFSNAGSVIPARNFIKEHATRASAARHWQLDDNIRCIQRWYGKQRVRCKSNAALACTEDFVDRYDNIAIAGLTYRTFAQDYSRPKRKPFYLNCHVYSCTLVDNSLPYGWRGTYNEDTDICLRVLADGLCTVLMNIFMCDKLATMTVKGGNTDALYHGDGRLKMARALERQWPGIVTTSRRFKRPQHVIKANWKYFDTPLRLKAGVEIDPTPNEYDMPVPPKYH